MKLTTLLLALALLSGPDGRAQNRFEWVLEPTYRFIESYREDIAVVKSDEGYGYIDGQGRQIVAPIYEQAYGFTGGRGRVQQNRKFGFVDRSGTIVIPVGFDFAADFYEGMAQVVVDSRWGFIDSLGELKIPAEYESSFQFAAGLAPVRKDGRWGFVDREGKVVIPFEYDFVTGFELGYAIVRKNGQEFTLNHPLKKAEPVQPSLEGYGNAGKGSGLPHAYKAQTEFHDGYSAVMTSGKFGFVDRRGELVVEPQFEYTGPVSNGLAPVKLNGAWGVIRLLK